MPLLSRLLTAALALLVAASLAITVDGPAAASPARSAQGNTAAAPEGKLNLGNDTVTPAGSRTKVQKWNVRTLWYYETLPDKWDWSLSTAVAKWNASGARIRLARTTIPSKAQVRISYASIGSPAGMATVGSTRNAFVHLSSRYASADALKADNRVTVMNVLAHELGHVLGFQHTAADCSLMAPVINVMGCNVLVAAQPGYYKCRTLDNALVRRFVKRYGGRARYPSASWCLIDPMPPVLGGVTFTGGLARGAPVGIHWGRPGAVPAGSRIVIRRWEAGSCFTLPAWADTFAPSLVTTSWQDANLSLEEAACFRIQLVNRYGAGRPAATKALTRFVVPPGAPMVGSATYVPVDHVFRAPVGHPSGTHLEYAAGADPDVCPGVDAPRNWVTEDVQRLGAGIAEFVSAKAPACVSFFAVHNATGKVSAPTSITLNPSAPTETVTMAPLVLHSYAYPVWLATVTGAATDHKVAYATLHGPCADADPEVAHWAVGQSPADWPDAYYFPSRGAGTNCALVSTVDWLEWNPHGRTDAHLDRLGPLVMREFVDDGPAAPMMGEPVWDADVGRFTLSIDSDVRVEAIYDAAQPTTCVAPGAASARSLRLFVLATQTVSLTPPAPNTCVTFYRTATDGDIRLSDGVERTLVVPQG